MKRNKLWIAAALTLSITAAGCEKDTVSSKPQQPTEQTKETKETKEMPPAITPSTETQPTDKTTVSQSSQKNKPAITPQTDTFNKEQAVTDIQGVIQDYAQAISDKNVEAYLETLSPSSPDYKDNEALMRMWSKQYDLNAKIESINVLEVNEKTAKVRVVQVLRNNNDMEFENERSTILFDMSYEGGWKIKGMTIEKTDYLPQ